MDNWRYGQPDSVVAPASGTTGGFEHWRYGSPVVVYAGVTEAPAGETLSIASTVDNPDFTIPGVLVVAD